MLARRNSRRAGSSFAAVMASMSSPSVKSPSCGGGSLAGHQAQARAHGAAAPAGSRRHRYGRAGSSARRRFASLRRAAPGSAPCTGPGPRRSQSAGTPAISEQVAATPAANAGRRRDAVRRGRRAQRPGPPGPGSFSAASGGSTIQHRQDQQAADARASEVGAVNTSGPRVASASSASPMALPAQKKGRASARYVGASHTGCHAIPQQLLGLKGQRRCSDRPGQREGAESHEIERSTHASNRRRAGDGEHDERAARAEAEQRKADHHVGVVVPVDDREIACQQDFVRERGAGYEGDGAERQPLSHERRSAARISPAGPGVS